MQAGSGSPLPVLQRGSREKHMKITSKIVTLILLMIFFIGFCVLLYPAFSQYWNSKTQSIAVAEYERMLQIITRDQYSAVFEKARSYNDNLRALDSPLRQYSNIDGYQDAMDVNGTGMIGYITISKISVELPIYHGTEAEVLNIGCGHMQGTSLPCGGESTHCVLSAHRGIPGARLFTDLDKMQVGDTFTITILDRVMTYEVDQVLIVEPSDTSEIQIVDGKDYCTLLTCTPYGLNTHRLLVRGHRIETLRPKVTYITSEAYLIDRLIVTPLVALPILFVLIAYVMLKPAKKTETIEDLLREDRRPDR